MQNLRQFAVADEFIDEDLGGDEATDMEALMPGHAQKPGQGHEHVAEHVLNFQAGAGEREDAGEAEVDHLDEGDGHQHHDGHVDGDFKAGHGAFGDGVEDVGSVAVIGQFHLTGKHPLVSFRPHDLSHENTGRSRHDRGGDEPGSGHSKGGVGHQRRAGDGSHRCRH